MATPHETAKHSRVPRSSSDERGAYGRTSGVFTCCNEDSLASAFFREWVNVTHTFFDLTMFTSAAGVSHGSEAE
jgi:hypothetical protein